MNVAGQESVEVPAGKFDTMKIVHEATIALPQANIRSVNSRWFAPNVGYVRQETETSAGERLLSRNQLTLVAFAGLAQGRISRRDAENARLARERISRRDAENAGLAPERISRRGAENARLAQGRVSRRDAENARLTRRGSRADTRRTPGSRGEDLAPETRKKPEDGC